MWAKYKKINSEIVFVSFFCNKYPVIMYLYFQSTAPVVDGLDPEGVIMYRLYRDATKYTKGTHVKVCQI